MPAPQSSLMQQAAKLKFQSFSLRVPHNWQAPQGEAAEHYGMAFKEEEKAVTPGFPPLFTPHSMNKYHVDAQKMLIGKFSEFIDGICSAICSAWSQWQTAATMTGVLINAVSASMGKVVGPPLTPLIMAAPPKATPSQLKYSNAVATVVGNAWLTYTTTIMIPGLPLFPAFAAVPSPVAPPTPSAPVPLMSLTQVTASLAPAVMKQQMVAALGDPQAQYHQQLFECVCTAFDQMFKLWQGTTMVTNIMGAGPVPSFAPPYMPAGPVIGGTGMMAPGGFV